MRGKRALMRLSGRGAVVGSVAAAALAGAGPAVAAAPGSADGGFGHAGTATLPAGTRLFAAAAQSNGDVVAVGESLAKQTPTVLLARFTPSGALDPSFGHGGIASGPAVSGAGGSLARAVAVEPDGRIVIAGEATDSTGSASEGLLVERFDANGTPDTSFGSGGVANMLSSSSGDGYSVAVQSNGEILAGGSASEGGTPYAAVVRLTSAGQPDHSFAGSGSDVIDLGAYSVAQALALQGNGDIVIAGSQSPGLQSTNALIARLTPFGALDDSFAGTGAIAHQYAPGGGAYSGFTGVAVQPNGEIVAGGNATGPSQTAYAFVARFTSGGAADGSFGQGGVAYAQAASRWEESNNVVPGAGALALAPGGDIVLAGQYDQSVLTYATLWAFTSSGALDPRFGSSGVALSGAGQGSEFAGLTVSPENGDLVGVGDQKSGISSDAGIASAFTGFRAPSPPPPSVSLKLALGRVTANYRGALARVPASCNEACSLTATLTAGAGAARTLHMTTVLHRCRTVHGRRRCFVVKRCRKVRGRRRCFAVRVYRPLRLAFLRASLGRAGSHVFVLHLSRFAAGRLHHVRAVSLGLTVTAYSAASRQSARATRTLRFVR
jgi:uncharacterized delta-60 repeat protein